MKFLRIRIENNEIIIYYENEKKEIIEKRQTYNRVPPLSNKKKDKLLNNVLIPDDMISDSKFIMKSIIRNLNLINISMIKQQRWCHL